MKNAIASAVYVMAAGDRVKIGRSKHPERRRKQLELGGGVRLTLVYATEIRSDASLVESTAHQRLIDSRVANEWFCVPVATAIEMVRNVVRELDVCVDRSSLRTRFGSLLGHDGLVTRMAEGIGPNLSAGRRNVTRWLSGNREPPDLLYILLEALEHSPKTQWPDRWKNAALREVKPGRPTRCV